MRLRGSRPRRRRAGASAVRRRGLVLTVALLLLAAAACGGEDEASTPEIAGSPEPLALVQVASGLASPMQVVAGTEPGVLYV